MSSSENGTGKREVGTVEIYEKGLRVDGKFSYKLLLTTDCMERARDEVKSLRANHADYTVAAYDLNNSRIVEGRLTPTQVEELWPEDE